MKTQSPEKSQNSSENNFTIVETLAVPGLRVVKEFFSLLGELLEAVHSPFPSVSPNYDDKNNS